MNTKDSKDIKIVMKMVNALDQGGSITLNNTASDN